MIEKYIVRKVEDMSERLGYLSYIQDQQGNVLREISNVSIGSVEHCELETYLDDLMTEGMIAQDDIYQYLGKENASTFVSGSSFL